VPALKGATFSTTLTNASNHAQMRTFILSLKRYQATQKSYELAGQPCNGRVLCIVLLRVFRGLNRKGKQIPANKNWWKNNGAKLFIFDKKRNSY
jgi:hypothetical protein